MVLDITVLASLALTVTGLCCALLYFASEHLKQEDAAKLQVEGCRRFGLLNNSNMNDQFSSIYNVSGDKQECKVKALFIYPIKSCGRIELSTGDVVASGLRYDRQFCFAQLQTEQTEREKDDISVNFQWKHKWKFITQRRFPRLSQVHTEIWLPDVTSRGYSPDMEWAKARGCLLCSFPCTPDLEWSHILEKETLRKLWTIIKAKLSAMSLIAEPVVTFRLPLAPDASRSANYTRDILHIWKDTPEAINITSELSPETLAQLKYYLGVSNPLGLFMCDPLKRRDVFRNAPTKEEAGYQPGTGFADAYPLSIMSLSSVQDVAKKLPTNKELSALRFRANIYITGTPPFAEDAWKLIRIGQLTYHVSCRTTRCSLPNVDQETGIAHKQEPYATLQKTRAYVDEGAGSNPCLGMQMVPLLKDETGSEEIAVKDTLHVLEVGEHFYVRMFQ